MSVSASFSPWPKVCCWLESQSSSPMSSSSRHIASWRSSSESHVVVRGKLGSTKKAHNAMNLEEYKLIYQDVQLL